MDGDTIAAIATPVGAGGIGVIRISGPESKAIAETVFVSARECKSSSRADLPDGNKLNIRRLQYGYVVDPKNDRRIDEVLVVYMPSPNSYTKEDVVEIQAHAGTLLMREILELLLQHGARHAAPGEFTQRAFLNGRIDLSKAEAVMDIIHARSERSLKIATTQLKGAISDAIEVIEDALVEIQCGLEVGIDFEEDVENPFDFAYFIEKIENDAVQPIANMIESYENGHFIREGLRLIILGRPNVGKSSLLNRFLETDRAIITEIPGTTRDSLEETLNISGLPVIIVDTAGWHDTADPVEKLGIKRAKELVTGADLVLLLVDAGQGIGTDDSAIYEYIKKKETILVVNKIDLIESKKSISIPKQWKVHDSYYISAKFNQGIDELKEGIFNYAVKSESLLENDIVPNLRQKTLLGSAKDAAEAAMDGLSAFISPELVAIDIKKAIHYLREIKGKHIKNDVLEKIFSQFCIGK